MLNYESKNTSSVLGVKRANDVLYFVTLDVFVRIRIDTVPKFRNGFFVPGTNVAGNTCCRYHNFSNLAVKCRRKGGSYTILNPLAAFFFSITSSNTSIT